MAADDRTQADDRREPRTGPPPLGAAFWRLWASSALSNLADGIFKVALPLVAIRFTDSPTLIAGLTFALTLPWLLFALPAGALADRLDRRRAMLGANTVRAVLLAVLALAAVTGTGSIWVLYAVAVCVGVTETIYDTSAQSILPQVVPRDRLSRANGRLHAAELTANEFVGPPVGGFLVAAGVAMAFVAPVALWAAAVGALLLVRGSFRIERERRTTMRADIAEGLRFLWRNRLLRTLAAMVGLFNFAGSATWAVLVLYAVGPGSAMGLSEPAYGLLLTASAAGSLLGSLLADRIERLLGRSRSIALTVFVGALFVGAPALTADPLLVGAAFFAGGVSIAVWNVITVSLRQRITPDRLLGRLNSAYRLLAWGTMPLGAAAGGLLAQFLGLRAVFAVMALLVLVRIFGMLVVNDRTIDAAEHEAARQS
ncbi:MFS transporter [Planobispora rosea]|uniref:MFS transporter n=1 Tax=Planobispora rosea TaxID=35762 RepID=A0A8J3RWM7_PLARO|nr:MFS transporter [Planobispora rosea]GGS63408.1 MFS transporter [Planobispora rosea]GIH84461.1 MFS transporter [Planobispora rosea]